MVGAMTTMSAAAKAQLEKNRSKNGEFGRKHLGRADEIPVDVKPTKTAAKLWLQQLADSGRTVTSSSTQHFGDRTVTQSASGRRIKCEGNRIALSTPRSPDTWVYVNLDGSDSQIVELSDDRMMYEWRDPDSNQVLTSIVYTVDE